VSDNGQPSFRVVVISTVLPIVEPLVARLRALGHEPIAWVLGRRTDRRPLPPWGDVTDRNAPAGVDLLFARDKLAIAPLLRGLEPDVVLCSGFLW